MMQQGVHPARIMALTFTNKAADEMKERIAHMVSYKQARQLWMGTFHSIFRRILKEEAYKLISIPILLFTIPMTAKAY
jgi:DNA helicase-2/ATP-dependent DNA helicase PcrA